MKYLLLICSDEAGYDATPEELDAEPWASEMDRRGVRLMGSRTRDAADATTVRVRDGARLLTDGPYAETKEQMAGFDVIECADLDEAIEVAAKHPVARYGMIEVRPFWTD
ncbi:YciI family protein [Streptomyces sp. NBC_01190]|uniref:YciI family protein n=1 Tax=Streptomyces sp. NBC_01190 TaxID=2903767 RepID=UPI00386D1AD4|nr:YciI family protein [Streptomyces sp. NBC_01190]